MYQRVSRNLATFLRMHMNTPKLSMFQVLACGAACSWPVVSAGLGSGAGVVAALPPPQPMSKHSHSTRARFTAIKKRLPFGPSELRGRGAVVT